uniref:Protein swallow n=1 Tax=Drosophila pseudoobscura pseudoobscura TaxID=46245 RepID=SWA_DROPS|nr:RecName: Full=Protein swallow [Drosophila pseudoobscura pseudoobscura]
MSLEDESFPADELFEQLNSASIGASRQFKSQFGEHDQPEAFERNPAPFLTSDCSDESSFIDAANKSAKTCVSDPVGLDQCEEEEEVDKDFEDSALANGNSELQIKSARSSKSVSYQDIHSAHTKRRYKHVTSKVAKYIADIHAQDQQRRNATKKFQRHSSMPEYLTPTARERGAHFSVDELHNLDESLDNSSAGNITDAKTPNDSYERLLSENERLQNDKEDLKSYSDYLQTKLDEKAMENMQLRRNFDVLRTDLTDCKEKLKRNQSYSLRSLNFCPPASVPKATQTDHELLSHAPNISRLSNMVAIADSGTPLPGSNTNNLTYDSSAGSIEVALLSVAPAARQPNAGKPKKNIQPHSLDFSNDSTEAEPNGNGTTSTGHSSSRAITSRRGAAPNNSESSHPSSNDSAIEVEALDLRSPYHRQPQGSIYPPMQDWGHSDGIYFFDKRNSRVIEVRSINVSQSSNPEQNSGTSETNLLNQSHVQFRHKRTSMGTRMLRLLGPCVRCTDTNQSVNASSATYTIGLPLLREEYGGRHTDR